LPEGSGALESPEEASPQVGDGAEWFIEVSVGLHDRNRFIKLKDLQAWRRGVGVDEELYSSLFRFPTDDPSVGPVLGGFCLDFDDEQQPDRARREALATAKFLIESYAVREADLSISFSGNKGFHLFVNRRVFGVEPDALLPRIFKSMAGELAAKLGLKTVDTKIYDRRRLIRLMNGRHGKTGYYKIPLTLSELESLKIDKIRALAVRPRTLGNMGEHIFSEAAAAWYRRHRDKIHNDLNGKRVEFTPRDFRGVGLLPCVKRRLEIGAEEGLRNRCAWQLASYFVKRGMSLEECLAIMRGWHARTAQDGHPFTWEECEATIRKAYEVGGYGIGCGSDFVADLCVGREECPLFKKRDDGEEYSEEERTIAEEILANYDPLKFIVDVVQLGHAGDMELILAEYISALSAALASSAGETINLWGIGRSGSGKTHSMIETLRALPKGAYEVFTSTSPKSYFYYVKECGEDALTDKMLFIDEAEASAEAEPVLRALTSRTEITPRHLSVYDANLLDLRITGKRSIWFTTTRSFGSEQLHNRFLFINPEEGAEQDEAVFKLQEENRLDIKVDETPYRIAQCMSKIIMTETKDRGVFIPYKIRWPFKERRYLYPMFLSFIKIIAKIRFKNRRVEEGFLIAEREDFETARAIWKAFEEPIVYRVSPSARALLEAIPVMEEEALTHAELAERTRKSTRQIQRLCTELLDAELINRKKREQPGRGRGEWEYWQSERLCIDEIEIVDEASIDEFRAEVEMRRMGWREFLPNYGHIQTFFGHETKSDKKAPFSKRGDIYGGKTGERILDISDTAERDDNRKKFFGEAPVGHVRNVVNSPIRPGTLRPTGNRFLYRWRRLALSPEACELCGGPGEIAVASEDSTLIRCRKCFEEMRNTFTKIAFIEEREGTAADY
jgi:predicted transcriptional regulator